MTRGLATVLALAALAAPACHEGGPTPPCVYAACSGHGTCVAEGETLRCECDPGFFPDGLTCLPESADAGPDGSDAGPDEPDADR